MRAVGEARREEARGVEPLEAREESSRGDARGERLCSSSLVQVPDTSNGVEQWTTTTAPQ